MSSLIVYVYDLLKESVLLTSRDKDIKYPMEILAVFEAIALPMSRGCVSLPRTLKGLQLQNELLEGQLIGALIPHLDQLV